MGVVVVSVTLLKGTSSPLRAIIAALTGTEARRRMSAVASTALLFGLVSGGFESVVLPLWATRELGLSPSEYAHLRSLRMGGTLIGVVLLGALSDRFGQRLLGALSMLACAGLLSVYGMNNSRMLWLTIPVFGAAMSTAFVNLNTLTQQISDRRQGAANSIYRSIYAVTGIAAPVIVTTVAGVLRHYAPVLLGLAGLLVLSACTLLSYPGEKVPSALGSVKLEVRRMLWGYRQITLRRELMVFLHCTLIWGSLLASIGTFAAIRFTKELGLKDQEFGALTAAGGVLILAATVLSGFLLDRLSLRKVHAVLMLAASGFTVLLGATDSRLASSVALIGVSLLAGILAAPNSIWVGREAGRDHLTAAFSVQKVLMALYMVVATLLFGLLESRLGIRSIVLWCGLTGTPFAAAILLLPEPGSRRVG